MRAIARRVGGSVDLQQQSHITKALYNVFTLFETTRIFATVSLSALICGSHGGAICPAPLSLFFNAICGATIILHVATLIHFHFKQWHRDNVLNCEYILLTASVYCLKIIY